MFTTRPIGFVRTPYTDTKSIPKGLGAKHDTDGTLEILPEFEPGLADIEGFSHLFVIWEFDRADGFDLFGRTGPTIRVCGVDMLDRTPILDLKPYMSSIPQEKLRRGWLAEAESAR